MKYPRNRKHLEAVAQLPCVCCGRPCEEVHHCRSLELGCGMGLKAPDEMTIPLCAKHHHDFHQYGKKTWEKLWGSQRGHIEATLKKLEELKT